MNLYLAGEHEVKNGRYAIGGGQKILETYYTARKNIWVEKLMPYLGGFMLDSGAFSFYYLAYRRGNEVDRRIGQTFAMLCAHDGDPIYQELGEAIYCWFISRVSKKLKESGL